MIYKISVDCSLKLWSGSWVTPFSECTVLLSLASAELSELLDLKLESLVFSFVTLFWSCVTVDLRLEN